MPASDRRHTTLRPRVILAVDLLELRLIHVGINLRGGNVAVTEKLLYDTEISPAGEQVGGEAVPQRVG